MNVVNHSVHEGNDVANNAAKMRWYFAWIMRVGTVLALVLGFLYLMLLNALATQGFALEELKSERIAIQKEMEKWDIELAIPVSLYALRSSEQVQAMEDVKEKVYLTVEVGQVAVK